MAKRASTTSDGSPDLSTRILVLYGPEDTLQRDHLDALRQLLRAAHGEVETVTFDGRSAPLVEVLDELRSLSLMQPYKLVIVDQADEFVARHREPITRYAQAPIDTATLVFRSVKWNKGNLDKLIEKQGALIRCDPLPEGELKMWVERRARVVHRCKLDARAGELLIERLGGVMGLIDGELGKLAVLAGEGQSIDTALVNQIVGRSSEEDAWMVQEAVLAALAAPPQLVATLAGAAATPAGAAIEKLRELIDLSRQPKVLVGYFIADMIRKLHLASALRRQGAGEKQIAAELRLFGPRLRPFMQALDRLTPAAGATLFDRIIAADLRGKTGLGETLQNLECFCATLGQGV